MVLPGYKYNMMDMQAALGLHQLPALDGFIGKRAALVARYREAFADLPQLTLTQTPPYPHRHAWHLLTVRVEGRDAFMQALKDRNIGTGLHYQAAHVFSWYKERYGWKPEDFPHALEAGERICSLPLFPDLTQAQQDRVIAAVREVLDDR